MLTTFILYFKSAFKKFIIIFGESLKQFFEVIITDESNYTNSIYSTNF